MIRAHSSDSWHLEVKTKAPAGVLRKLHQMINTNNLQEWDKTFIFIIMKSQMKYLNSTWYDKYKMLNLILDFTIRIYPIFHTSQTRIPERLHLKLDHINHYTRLHYKYYCTSSMLFIVNICNNRMLIYRKNIYIYIYTKDEWSKRNNKKKEGKNSSLWHCNGWRHNPRRVDVKQVVSRKTQGKFLNSMLWGNFAPTAHNVHIMGRKKKTLSVVFLLWGQSWL